MAGVVAHGAWSARKNQPKLATVEDAPAAGSPPLDIDFSSDERQEPSFSSDLANEEGGGPPHGSDANLASLARLTAIDKKPLLDALIDVIVPIAVDSPASGEAALNAMPSTRRAGSKPFGIEGMNAATAHWELPLAGQRYSAFQCGVQLANRMGALNQIEYSEFVIKLQAFADDVGGAPEFPEMLDEVARARELDQFASTHDAQLSFTQIGRASCRERV